MAKQAKQAPERIPWSNCRLLLASEADEDADLPQGIVGRLYFSPVSHQAVRQSWQGLHPRKLALPALAVQNLINRRGPDALVGRIPGETVHSARLLQLCKQCHTREEVLVCSISSGDVVLVPRLPSVAEVDNLYFLAYATNIKAVELCESLRSLRQVAVVLDIDNTLIDATPVSISDDNWSLFEWRPTATQSSSGRRIQGQIAHIPGSDLEDPAQERAFLIHWEVGRLSCTFKVRVRQGWSTLKQFLVENCSRFAPFVCSKGKLEYVQLIWHGLDPESLLIPHELWEHRMTSTFPDSLTRAAQKTALIALGCANVLRPMPPTQLAAPVLFLDDSPEAYDAEYSDSILFVEEFRPSDGVHADRGSVFNQVIARLETYWSATCGEAGSFAWQAAQSFATAILGAMQRTPMESPDALAYLQGRCTKQGLALWHQITVSSVFNNDVYVADQEGGVLTGSGGSGDSSSHQMSHHYYLMSGSGGGDIFRPGSSPPQSQLEEVMHPLLKEASMTALQGVQARAQAQLQAPRGGSGGGGGVKRPLPQSGARGGGGGGEMRSAGGGVGSTDEALHASLMLQC